jgi:hypothetical protein
MIKRPIVRRSLAGTAGAAAAILLMSGGAEAAQAPRSAQAVSASASSTSYALPGYGSAAIMPTWPWGGTQLCAFNYGSTTGMLKVQSVTGAPPEYISGIAPFTQKCINRWWFGVPVWTTNVSSTPLYVTGS